MKEGTAGRKRKGRICFRDDGKGMEGRVKYAV
jgi:hypothetical protein